MKKQLNSIISLLAICAVVAVLMAVTNYVTAPFIQKNEDAAANAALLEVMPDGSGFEKVDLASYTLPSTVTEAYRSENGGYVFKLKTSGYSSDMIIMCGVNADGTVSGAVCLSSGETLGYEKTYGASLKGKTSESIDGADVISGATKTTEGYKKAVKDALNAFTILCGGSVDLRTEEEILLENLSAALPAAEGKFTSWFFVEELTGVDAIYTADNGSGAVYVCGEAFVAVDAEGNVLSEVSEELREAVEAQAEIVLASTMTELTLADYQGLPTNVEKAWKTASGNFVLEIRASGFGINGDDWYNPSGEFIKIRVSVTDEGKIIACQTIYQAETDGIGSACEDPEFYTQFNGKTESNYGDIDAISGATVTTNGYKAAISKVFEAVRILKGGATE